MQRSPGQPACACVIWAEEKSPVCAWLMPVAGDAPASPNAKCPCHSSLSDGRGDPVTGGASPALTRCGSPPSALRAGLRHRGPAETVTPGCALLSNEGKFMLNNHANRSPGSWEGAHVRGSLRLMESLGKTLPARFQPGAAEGAAAGLLATLGNSPKVPFCPVRTGATWRRWRRGRSH